MSAFTQKHMVAIASVLNDLTVTETRGIHQYSTPIPSATYHAFSLIESMCDMLAEDNPKFDRKRFIKACGFEPWDELIMGVPFNNDNAKMEDAASE